MKYTLLEMVQNILAAMEDDEVNSYSDTAASVQVAGIIKESYFDIVGRANLPEHYDFFELTASGDTTKPTVMTIPEACLNLNLVKYNNFVTDEDDGPRFVDVSFKPVNEFIDDMYALQVDDDVDYIDTFTDTVGTATVDFIIRNDKFPEWYTTGNDNKLYFDSYYSDEDATLVGNKTLAYGLLAPTFTMSNSFVPDLDATQFSLLLNEAKSQAFVEMKQTPNPKAEQRSRKNWVSLQRNKRAIPAPYSALNELPNYGRKSGRQRISVKF